LEALVFTDMMERRRVMPLDLPKYLGEPGVMQSVPKPDRNSLFARMSESLSAGESSPWLPDELGMRRDACKGEASLEEPATIWEAG
jgi:hypothetical protein